MYVNNENTHLYTVEQFDNMIVQEILRDVYAALEEKGYNPVNQIVGYLVSGDPGYISNYKNARSKISKVDRNTILETLLNNYINNIK